jgi:2-polyprenyl-6-methoxyphenol hydroxylase-like FAD-dependent oxidoreductase
MPAEVPVLIVGGSLNGLTAALCLAHHGIKSLVVERHPSTTVQYKFRGISPRSMEIYRSLGIEPDVRQRDTCEQSFGIARAKTLSDPNVHWEGPAWPDITDLSPTPPATCDQDRLEPILRMRAEKRGADIRFNTELTSIEQDGNGIRARISDLATGAEQTITADYMIAADGANGSTRKKLGVSRQGVGVLQHWMNIIFETDLKPYLGGKRFTSCFVTDINGSILPRDETGKWLLAIQYVPERGEVPEQFDAARCRELVRKAAGRANVKAELVDARSWEVAAYITDRFRHGRTLFVGDAAHLMPPTGGFGGNTGIHDAHNLAWKLAAVIEHGASPSLLDSYDAERRPVAEATLAQALARLSAWFKDPIKRLPPPVKIVDELNVIFGQAYPAGAFVPESSAEIFEDPRSPSGRPGSRAPHVVVERSGEKLSTLDLFGRGFVLLAGARGAAWREAASEIALSGGPKLDAYQFGSTGKLTDVENRWEPKYGVNEDGAVLVRPDGIIAWRTRAAEKEPETALRDALQQIGLEMRKKGAKS